MHIQTTTHILGLTEEGIYQLRKATGDQDDWLDTRKGEAYGRRLHVAKRDDDNLGVWFDDKDCGSIALDNPTAVAELTNFVRWWNEKAGPTDLATAKIAEQLASSNEAVQRVSIRATTWNCGGAIAGYDKAIWDQLAGSEDVQIFGFQETDRLDRSVSANPVSLQQAVSGLINSLENHSLAASVQLLGMMSLVFVRKSIPVTHVETDTSSTGFMKMWGNKGAVLTKMRLWGDELLGGGLCLVVVNCHLSAGEGDTQISRRRWELGEIGVKFGVKLAPADVESPSDVSSPISSISNLDSDDLGSEESAPAAAASSFPPSSPLRRADYLLSKPAAEKKSDHSEHSTLEDEDYSSNGGDRSTGGPALGNSSLTFVLGDLNYRILIPGAEVRKLVTEKNWPQLLERDSLSIERAHGVLEGFNEAAISFAPTYKYEPGSTERYADRVPSYTDRVLFKTLKPLDNISYNRIALSGSASDHLPVFFTADATTNRIDEKGRSSAVSQALRLVDAAENRSRPRATVDPQLITVTGRPLSASTYHVELRAGGGQRPFDWIAKSGEPRLLSVTPERGTLRPASPPQAHQKLEIRTRMPPGPKPQNHLVEIELVGGIHTYIAVAFEPLPSVLGSASPPLDIIERLAEWLEPRAGELVKATPKLDVAAQLLKWIDCDSEWDETQLDAASVWWLLLEILRVTPSPLLAPNRQSELPKLAIPVLRLARTALKEGASEPKILEQVARALYDGPKADTYIKGAIIMA